MIPFRVIRSAVLLTGLLSALAPSLSAASRSFTATLSPEQKTEAGLATLGPGELTALDQLVATDIIRARHVRLPALADPYSQRYTEAETKVAGLDRLTPEQLAKLDTLITAAVAAAPQSPSIQPRERPRVRDGEILSEKGRLQVHGGMSLTKGWASGGRNFREVGAWVSYFDPVTGLGLSYSFSRTSGDLLGSYYGRDYSYNAPYLYATSRAPFTLMDRTILDRNEFTGDGASLSYPTLGRSGEGIIRR